MVKIAEIAIVDMSIDEYIGDGDDGVYWTVAQGPDGWYGSAIVDSYTGHFETELVSDKGPYQTEGEAITAMCDLAKEWCRENCFYSWED